MTTQPTPTRQKRDMRPWWVLAIVAIPVFVGSIDLTIVSAFLPEIIVNLELPIQSIVDDASWIITGYLLAYTVSLTFMGRLSDLIGRRTAFIACLIIFMVGSFLVASVDPGARTGFTRLLFDIEFRLTGARPDPANVALTTIIVGRIVQALGAGAIVPVSLALVGDMFPRERRAQPLGLVGAIDTLGWMLGHLYGGVMVRFFSTSGDQIVDAFASFGLVIDRPDWRTLFWLNLPIALVALVGVIVTLRGVPQTRSQGRFDLLGALLIGAAVIGLVVGLGANLDITAGTTSFEDLGGLPTYAAPVLIGALILFVLFIVVELRSKAPLFNLRVFQRRNTAAGLGANFLVGFCLMIGLVSVPILVNIRLIDPSLLSEAAFQAGILLSALTLPMALAALPGGWLSDRIGYWRTTTIGFVLALVGFVSIALTWELATSDWTIALQMILIGIGLGLTFSPISAAVINDADEEDLGSASALVIVMRLLGMTIGISALTAFASWRLTGLAAIELGAAAIDPFAALDVYARLTVQVLTEMAVVGAAIAAIGIVPALLLRKRRTLASANV